MLCLIHGVSIQIRSRRDNADNFPLNQSLRLLWIFYLFTDCNLISFCHQTVQICICSMIRNAAHRSTLFKSAVFSCQCDLQCFGCRQGIVKKHFIEITQAIKKNTVLVLFLCLQIFCHHRRYGIFFIIFCCCTQRSNLFHLISIVCACSAQNMLVPLFLLYFYRPTHFR